MTISTIRIGQWFALLTCIVGLAGCLEVLPGGRLVDEVTVPLPNDGRLQVSYRVRASTPEFEVIARNPYGSARQKLWEDWGPAKGGNVYVTPDSRVVIIGGGGAVYLFEVRAGKAPRIIKDDFPSKKDGREWEYLGAFMLRDGGQLTFSSPSIMSERISLFGGDKIAYRRAAQVPHD